MISLTQNVSDYLENVVILVLIIERFLIKFGLIFLVNDVISKVFAYLDDSAVNF